MTWSNFTHKLPDTNTTQRSPSPVAVKIDHPAGKWGKKENFEKCIIS